MTDKVNKIRIISILLMFLATAVPLYSYADETITLEQAIDIALKKNPNLTASRSDVDAALARVTQSTASYYPQVSASAGYDHSRDYIDGDSSSSGTSDGRDYYSTGISVSQLIYDFGKTPAQVESSSQTLESSKKSLKADEKTLVENVKESYFEALKNQQLVNVKKESLEVLKKHLEQARALYKEGMRPKIDVTRGEVEVSQAELQLLSAGYTWRRALMSLEKLLGGAPESGTYLLAEVNPTFQAIPELKSLVDMAVDRRPELKALKAQANAAEAEAEYTKKSAYPSLSAKGSYSYYTDDSPLDEDLNHSWQVGLSVNWPLFTGFRQTGQVAESKANIRRMNALYENQVLSIIEEVKKAYLSVKEAEETIKTAETALRQAGENLEMAEGRYQTGVSDSIELSDAQVLYTESKSSLVQAVYDHHKSLAGLEFAVGGDWAQEDTNIKDN